MSTTDEVKWSYGCVFCVTGKEAFTAQRIEQTCGDVRTVVARQLKIKSDHGKKRTEEVILFPGYVFFHTPAGSEIISMFPKDNIYTVLKSESGDWQLYGEDALLVKWLFSYGGLISFSKAYQEGDRIKIISGPLKDLEGQILRIDRRNQSGKVAIPFCNRVINAWLGFEMVKQI